MNVKGGGVTYVYVLVKIGVLLAKGSIGEIRNATNINTTTASISTTTIQPTFAPETANNNIFNWNYTDIPRDNPVNNSTSIVTTASKSTSSISTQSTSSTSPKNASITTLKSTSASTSKSTLTSSASTMSHPTLTSVLSSSLSTSFSTNSSSISSISSSTVAYNPMDVSTTINDVTNSSANISSTHVPKIENNLGLHISAGTALGIFLIALILVIAGSILFYKMKKNGNLPCQSCKVCLPRRRRRSSTSSCGPLTQQDNATFVNITDAPRSERELFSIGDQDGGQDGRPRSMQRRGTEDDYFYDEIFGTSAFVDETTNRANTHLTVDDDDDELGGLNIPDLVFKESKRV